MPAPQKVTVSAADSGKTLAALVRALRPDRSWSEVRRLIETRHARINGELCQDGARRLHEGEVVELHEVPGPLPRHVHLVTIRHLDSEVVVVEKPSGVSTVRYGSERDWGERRKMLTPTLEDLVPRLMLRQGDSSRTGGLPNLRAVHRLDKETSGLVVFARTVPAERALGLQFKNHTVIRRYLAIIPGVIAAQTIRSHLIPDRGDGRRGSTPFKAQGKHAVTHVEVVETFPSYSLLSCRLETGRTHQIRIHLSELGYPLCGEKVYNRPWNGPPREDTSGAPRLALHACELGFIHPTTGQQLHWEMPLPQDLQEFVTRLRA